MGGAGVWKPRLVLRGRSGLGTPREGLLGPGSQGLAPPGVRRVQTALGSPGSGRLARSR